MQPRPRRRHAVYGQHLAGGVVPAAGGSRQREMTRDDKRHWQEDDNWQLGAKSVGLDGAGEARPQLPTPPPPAYPHPDGPLGEAPHKRRRTHADGGHGDGEPPPPTMERSPAASGAIAVTEPMATSPFGAMDLNYQGLPLRPPGMEPMMPPPAFAAPPSGTASASAGLAGTSPSPFFPPTAPIFNPLSGLRTALGALDLGHGVRIKVSPPATALSSSPSIAAAASTPLPPHTPDHSGGAQRAAPERALHGLAANKALQRARQPGAGWARGGPSDDQRRAGC